MELFAKLFSSLLVFVYHCFDRMVIHGYLLRLLNNSRVLRYLSQHHADLLAALQTVVEEASANSAAGPNQPPPAVPEGAAEA